jgi:peptidyl-prolyl cis-trans isomerase D
MSTPLRAKGNKTIVWILLGLLIIGLTGFGIGGIGSSGVTSVATVGDEKITVNTYALALRNSMQSMSAQIGQPISPALAESLGIQRNTLQSVLASATLDNETRILGLSVGDEAVRDELMTQSAFQDRMGIFDPAAYEFALQRTGLSATEYDSILRKESARALLQGGVAAGVVSGDTTALTLLAYARETRDFEWAELSADALSAPIDPPTEAEIQSRYEATPEAYTAPLTRKITYVHLAPQMLADQVNIDEASIEDAYKLQEDRFLRPERRFVDRLIFPSLDAAKEARDRLDAGIISFPALVAELGQTEVAIDLGPVDERSFTPGVADMIFGGEEPGVFGPAETSYGPALFRVNAIVAEQQTSLEDARPELLAELTGEAERRLVLDMIADIDDLLAAGSTLEEIAADTDMQLGTISLTDTTQDGIAAYENFRQAANAATKEDFPEIKDLADGGVFALRVDEIIEPTLIDLAEVRDRVIADWARDQIVAKLTKMAQDIKLQLENGSDFTPFGLEPTTETNVARNGFIEAVPGQIVTDMFDLEPRGVAIAPGIASVFIARLISVTPFDQVEGDNAALLDQVRGQIDSQLALDMLQLFTLALQEKARVTLNQAALNSINTQIASGQ